MKKEKETAFNKNLLIGIFLLILSFSFISGAIVIKQDSTNSMKSAVSTLDKSMCENNQDILVEVPYLSCTPYVVRSDLLEEEDVYVHCPLIASSINPFLTIGSFDNVQFTGSYSPEIRGVGFKPSQSFSVQGVSVESEDSQRIGYAYVQIKQQPNESAMPEFVEANLSARVYYTPAHSKDYQTQKLVLRELNDYELGLESSFWDDSVSVKAESITKDKAIISVRDSLLKEIANVELSLKEESQEIAIPGIGVCDASMTVKLDELSLPETYARLIIDRNIVEVTKGSKILDGACTVTDLIQQGLFKTVTISCGKNNLIQLTTSPQVTLKVGDAEEKRYEVGDILKEGVYGGKYTLFLGYIGKDYKGDLIIVSFLSTAKTKEDFLKSTPTLRRSLNYIQAVHTPDEFIVDLIQLGAQVSSNVVNTLKNTWNIVADAANNWFDLAIPKSSLHAPLAVYIRESGGIWAPKLTTFDSVLKANDKKDIPEIEIIGLSSPENQNLETAESYYTLAKEEYQKVIQDYPNEKETESVAETIAEKAYIQLIILANDFSQKEDVMTFCAEFEERYPASASTKTEIKDICSNLEVLSSSKSNSGSVVIKEKLHQIFLQDVHEPGKEDYSIEVRVSSLSSTSSSLIDKTLGIGEKAFFPGSNKDYFVLESINDVSATIKAYYSVADTRTQQETLRYSPITISLDGSVSVPGTYYAVKLNKINLRRNAKISIIPKFNADYSDVKFNVKIGIEKRGVKLSPEKTTEAIKNINASLEKWNKTSTALGKVVNGLNKACTATQTYFTIKNFFAGLSGEGLARQKIMRGAGGWTEFCNEEYSKENSKYNSAEECFLEYSGDIDTQVKELAAEMDKVNQEVQLIKQRTNPEDKTGQIESFIKEYCAAVSKKLVAQSGEESKQYKDSINSLIGNEVSCVQNWKTGKFSEDDLTEISLYVSVLSGSSTGRLKEIAQKELDSIGGNAKEITQPQTTESYKIESWPNEERDRNKIRPYYGETLLGKDIAISSGDSELEPNIRYPVKIILYNQYYYLLVLQKIEAQEGYFIYGTANKAIYSITPNKVPLTGTKISVSLAKSSISSDIISLVSSFEVYESGSYQNPYKNPQIKYYETEPYKGMPAIVPFNKTHGWYAAMKQTLPYGSNIAPQDVSTRINSFYLCNVGKNGLEEFFSPSYGDDTCTLMNLNTGQPYNQFPGLTESEAAALVTKAEDALNDAQSAYKSGLQSANILGQSFAVGASAVSTPDVQCQDVMSPKECNIMFNVCDPVTCPSSRCDFGGKYPVSDVVQTGIIGSIALCLPNAKEGIAIPVCLTGVQAGVDGLMSVQKSYRDCLQENLDTGKTVGICDEIMSIYYCEFLFEQAGPLVAELGVSGVLSALNTNSRGGGEYLYASDAVSSAKKSYQYFTQSYSTNSQSVFSSQSLQGLGKGICKTFISTVYPSVGEGLDEVQQTTEEINSPPQYHARFDEIVLTTATVPPQSQYKVFYHIFAGNEAGVYYNVYLRGGDELAYYQDTNKAQPVASGFIQKGAYASETKDFSAPAGYKQLCISINGQEECGFKQVSTSLAVDYLTEKYVAEQASSTDITAESECISGKLNWGALLNLNAQSAASELIDPAIYNKGIARMCSTDNPGLGSDPKAETTESRWIRVGYCDDPEMKCWLDTQEVKEILGSPDLANFLSNGKTQTLADSVLEDVEGSYLEFLKDEGKYFNDEEIKELIEFLQSESEIGKLNSQITEITGSEVSYTSVSEAKLKLIDLVFARSIFTKDKAKLILIKADIYAKLAREKWEEFKQNIDVPEMISNAASTAEEIAGSSDAILPTENTLTWTASFYSELEQITLEQFPEDSLLTITPLQSVAAVLAIEEVQDESFLTQSQAEIKSLVEEGGIELAKAIMFEGIYRECKNRKTPSEQLKCSLSILGTGKPDTRVILSIPVFANSKGIKFAEDVIKNTAIWVKRFEANIPPECYEDNECEAASCEYIEVDDSCTKICSQSTCEEGKCILREISNNQFRDSCEDVKYDDCFSPCQEEEENCKSECSSAQEAFSDICISDCDNELSSCSKTCSSN